MDFKILGPLEVHDGNSLLNIGGTRQRALLALLLLHANEVVSSERLVEELWSESRFDESSKALQVAVSRLRRTLEPGLTSGQESRLLVTRAPGYELRVHPEQVDLQRFEAQVSEARAALAAQDPATAAEKLNAALGLWRGPPLADFAFESFSQEAIARLEELRAAALEDRVAAELELGRHAELVGELQALARRHPLRERLREQLMLALYRSGRQAEALEVYRDARRVLVEELGIEPGRALVELERQILSQDASLDLRRRASGTTSPVDGSPGQFVGREPELAEFLARLDGARAGRAAVLLIAGEPGIGKSRLAHELATRAQGQGASVLWGRCWEAGGAPAYWPWVQALRSYVRQRDPDAVLAELGTGAVDVARILPEVAQLLPAPPGPAPGDPEAARFRLFDSTASFLRAAGDAQPLVVVLDDLHAGDTPSLLLLRFLAKELRQARVVLVAAYRDTQSDASDALTEALAELRREPTTRLVQLSGLQLSEVPRFVKLIADTEPDEAVTAVLHSRTEGNPLFLGEIVRLLASEGRLDAVAETSSRRTVPQGLREVIGHRLRRLSADCKRALTLASVFGRDFRLDALERLGRWPRGELLDLLDEALAARVVISLESGRGGLRFAHALIRDSLYEGLGANERLELHRRAAEVLEELYGRDREPHLAELAHHFLEAAPAGEADKAVEYALLAGNRAKTLVAYEEAARLYEMGMEALELAGRRDDPARCELLLALGDAQSRGGDLGAAKQTFVRAADVAKQLGAPSQLARAALGYGGRIVWFRAGKDRRVIQLLEDALEAQPEFDTGMRAMLLARLAGALRGDLISKRRAALAEEAVKIARGGDRETLAYALEGTYAAISWLRDTDRWLSMASELSRIGEELGDMEKVFFGHLHAYLALMVRGELQAAEHELARATTIAEDLRQPTQFWMLAVTESMRALYSGRFEDAGRLIDRAIELGSGAHGGLGSLDEATFDYVTTFQNWALRRETGRLAAVCGSLERFVAEYPTLFLFRCMLLSAYTELGDADRARAELERLGSDGFRDLELGIEWFFSASMLAEVCERLGETGHAPRLYRALRPYGGCVVMTNPEICLGSAARYLGLLASSMGRPADAVSHFEQALATNARMGARPWVARTQADLARTLLARGAPGDRDQAGELARAALETFGALGMEDPAKRMRDSIGGE